MAVALENGLALQRNPLALHSAVGAPQAPTDEQYSPAQQERSRAERFFSRPDRPVGESVAGSRASEKERPPEGAPFYRLLVGGEKLSPEIRVNLYLQMEPADQKRFLELLPVSERNAFQELLGDAPRLFPEDLRSENVDLNLRQFGYDFFDTRKGGFSPEYLGPVGPDYVIGPGDTMAVTIWGSFEASFEVTVDRNGDVTLPKVGTAHLWGQTLGQARETIHKQVSRDYKDFELNVSMGSLRSIQVYLVGEVDAPGTYTLSSLATVLNALAAAGGPAKTGSLRQVQLLRNGSTVATIDFYDFFLAGDRSRDGRLQSGDTIYVPISGPLVGVAGDVRRPAIYELKGEETLGAALAMAGGLVPTAYLKRVEVERVEAHRKGVVLDLNLEPGASEPGRSLNFPLQDRDLVKVAAISPASASYVLLKGYVARPGRYQYQPELRLADLLVPYDNLLPDYYPGLVEILRIAPPDFRPARLTVDLGKALAGDPDSNLLLQKFDEIRLFARTEMEEVPKVEVTGAVLRPGAYRLYSEMTVRDLIAAAGNIKRSAYLAEAELTRFVQSEGGITAERPTFDLGMALAGDPSQNLILAPDDHLFIRTIPDFAEKHTVTLNGRVRFPGTYSVAQGERLSSLLERAGGFAEDAYLRGAVFNRQSLKEIQSRRLEQLLFEQEQAIFRASAEIAQGALGPEELKSAESLLEARKQQLQKLKQMPVTGRMVVHLAPLVEFRRSEYDLELMDGDTITVPVNPLSVTVLGKVYNPVSLSYRPGKAVSYYLDKVGGPTRDAEKDEMFIIRADGTVFSRQQAGTGVAWDSENFRWVFGGFNVTELYPGDTVLVPEKVKRVDVMREVKDLTTILYQIALGAAAVASF